MLKPDLKNRPYVVQVASSLWENLPSVIWGATLFSIFCAPAFVLFSIGFLAPALLMMTITVGPAWTALQAYESPIVEGQIPRTATFFQTLRTCFGRSTRFSMLGSFPLLMLLTTLPALQIEPIPFVVWLGLGADLFGCAIMATLLLYAFPLLALQDAPVRATLRNAFILAGRYPSNTLGLLGMGILFAFGIIYLSLGLLLILPAIFGLFVVANCQLVLRTEEVR